MRALARWLGLAPGQQLGAARWVVIDCETSGLDAAHDRLLALGAVAVRGAAIEMAESFSAQLRQDVPSDAANVLVHGIGHDAQRAGRAPQEALRDFARFLGDGMPVAFHAAFDAEVLRRAMAAVPGLAAPRRWLDLAQLAPVLYPAQARGRHALDEWLEAFGIAAHARHDALGDAYATAQLLLVLLAEAARQRLASVEDLQQAARSRRWSGS